MHWIDSESIFQPSENNWNQKDNLNQSEIKERSNEDKNLSQNYIYKAKETPKPLFPKKFLC